MPDTPENEDPSASPGPISTRRSAAWWRSSAEQRPQVMLTYGDDQEGYPHPDHLRVHDVSMLAIDAAADADRFPDAGEPWLILKIYYSAWSRARVQAMHEAFLEHGLESPFDKRWFDRPSQDHRLTTHIDVTGLYDVRAGALKAHATQIDPELAVLVRAARGDRVRACTRRTTSSWPAARCRRPRPRTISSPGYRSASDLRSPARAVQARNGGARWRST